MITSRPILRCCTIGVVAAYCLGPEIITERLGGHAAHAQVTNSRSEPQTILGAGNQQAINLSRKSPMVQSALKYLVTQAGKIRDSKLRKETLDAIANPNTCIQHRANLTEADKSRILRNLSDLGLLDTQGQASFPGGLLAGIFPPVLDDGSECPHLPQEFVSAPGGASHGHHSYPGGLPIHEANNELAIINSANQYRSIYGHSSATLPTVDVRGAANSEKANADISINQDIILAAPIWHDWAKSIVFQWERDGSEFQEITVGGNGMTDNNGLPGDSKTGAHHILSLAESMKRGLSSAFVITQASAHSAPSNGNEFKVVNWLRAAAMIAQVDPVRSGYLSRDANGHWWLPALRQLSRGDGANSTPPSNLLIECTLHNISDTDSFSGPALRSIERVLLQLSADFGLNPKDGGYNTRFRNPVLSFLTAERLLIIYSEKGLDGIKGELRTLRRLNLI